MNKAEIQNPEFLIQKPDISIIIVNWNARDLLVNCLNSIIQTAGNLDIEIIVVDNSSTDGSQVTIRQQFPQVNLIENDQNVGFARANNQALAIDSGRYMLLLNSDTIVLPGALTQIVCFADNHPDVGVIGCKLLNTDGSLQESWASFPTIWSELLGRNFRDWRFLEQTPLAYEVDWVGGACLLVRPASISVAGLLDESFFMYSEETDWCFRIKQEGWKVCYLSSAEIIHLGGGSASRASLIQLVRLYESKIHFFRKHYGAYQAGLLRWGLVVANTLGLIRHALAWPLRPKEVGIRQRLDMRRELIWRLLHS